MLDSAESPLDLSGATIRWKLNSVDGASNILTLDNAGNGGVTIVTPSTATILRERHGGAESQHRPGHLSRLAAHHTRQVLTEWSGNHPG